MYKNTLNLRNTMPLTEQHFAGLLVIIKVKIQFLIHHFVATETLEVYKPVTILVGHFLCLIIY